MGGHILGEQVYLATDLNYLVTTHNLLYGMPNVRHLKEKSKRGIFSFEVIDDPAFIGVLIQVTSKGRVNIYLPKGAPKEEVVEKTLKLLKEANQAPIKVLSRKESREFMTLEEYKVRLEHSRELFKECYIPPFSSELIPPRFEDKNLLQHLKTGYPDIYEERNKCYSSYCEKVESIALKVKHGEPLKGWCNLCPKITIGR